MSESSTNIRGETIVITGASSGIGEAAAKLLARAGAHVVLVARREDELARVSEEIESAGGHCNVYAADLSEQRSVDEVADAILRDHPRIDVLVNNAARSIRRSIKDSLDRFHDYKRTMQLNYFGAVQLTLRLLPRFLEQGSGHVIMSSTMSTQVAVPLFSAYVASKSALESFARSLSAEMGVKGIAVTTINFPMVRTPMSGRTDIYRFMPMMKADTAAGWIVEAVEKRPARIARAFGTLSSIALTAMPGPVTKLSQRAMRAMDYQLKKLARQLED